VLWRFDADYVRRGEDSVLVQGQYDPNSIVVLVVEDDAADLELACRAVLGTGIPRCFTLATGESALAWLEQHDCDIVVFEHNLAGMNGQQFMSLVKQTRPAVRLIATSSNKDPRFAVSWMKNGAADYVAKDDFYSSQLARAVQACARDLTLEHERRTSETIAGSANGLEIASSEANWLLKLFRSRFGYTIPLPVDRENELRRWADVVQTFHEYLETSLRMFPEVLFRSEDVLVRMILERGLSPRDVVLLYQLALMKLKEASRNEQQQSPRVHPGVFLSRVLVRLVEEYQRAMSFEAQERVA
jgi:DNA-binding NarL/FixJ family response regulator